MVTDELDHPGLVSCVVCQVQSRHGKHRKSSKPDGTPRMRGASRDREQCRNDDDKAHGQKPKAGVRQLRTARRRGSDLQHSANGAQAVRRPPDPGPENRRRACRRDIDRAVHDDRGQETKRRERDRDNDRRRLTALQITRDVDDELRDVPDEAEQSGHQREPLGRNAKRRDRDRRVDDANGRCRPAEHHHEEHGVQAQSGGETDGVDER